MAERTAPAVRLVGSDWTGPWFGKLGTCVLAGKEFRAETQNIRGSSISEVTEVEEVSGRKNRRLGKQVAEAKAGTLGA